MSNMNLKPKKTVEEIVDKKEKEKKGVLWVTKLIAQQAQRNVD